jgi:hypothetical protein
MRWLSLDRIDDDDKHRSFLAWLRKGRGVLYLTERLSFRAEWHWLAWRWFHVGVELGGWGDDNFTLAMCPSVFSFYLSADGLPKWLRRWLPEEERECSIAVHDGCVWINPWARVDEWRSKDPWWHKGLVLHVDDWLRGRAEYSAEVLQERDVLIPMPEGAYPATGKLERCTWSRARWRSLVLKRVTIKVSNGIPHEGKGENSWDCGEDATYSITCPADTIEDGIGKLVASVLESRKHYGGGHEHRGLATVLAPQKG